MAEYRRRADDGRIDNIEKIVMELHAKINNGLSERSKETRDQVNSLHARQEQFEQKFSEHAVYEQMNSKHFCEAVSELTTLSKDMIKTQKSWEKKLIKAFWGTASAVLLFAGWVIYNQQAIAEILAPLYS